MDNQELSDEGRLRELYSASVEEREVVDRANCVDPEAILALVLGEAPEADRMATLDHVMSCPACHRDYEYLSAVEEAGDKTERIAGRRAPSWRRALPLAAAASLVLAIGGLMLRGRGDEGVERGGGGRDPVDRAGRPGSVRGRVRCTSRGSRYLARAAT